MKTILFIPLLFIFTTIRSQEAKELDPVTVSSSFKATKVSQTGRNIIYIKGDEFSKLPASSIDELLRYVPGVEVQMRGPSGSQSDIVLRGGTFQQVLVMLDGVRLNDPNTGHFNSYIPIAPGEIDHIEILKGASSAIYGSEAVGGVINIITKTFAAKRGQPGKQFGLEAKAGEYRLIDGNGSGFYQKNNTAISGGILTDNSNGQLQRGTRGYYYNRTGSLSFKQFLNDHWSFAARSSCDTRDFSAQNFYTTFVSDTATEKINSFWNQLNLQYQKNKHALSFDAGYKAVQDHYDFSPASPANENHSYLFQSNVTDNYHVTANTYLISGVQYQRKRIRSNDRGNHELNQLAGFVIWDQAINKFSFSPSVRLDYNDRRRTEFVPQINLSYHSHQLQLRASAGKTIRDADFTERYNNYNKTLVTSGSIGNPDLESERSFSYEAGADYFISKMLKLSTSFFQRRQSNVIDWVNTPYNNMPRKVNLSPTGMYALASNISKVVTTGEELDVQFNKTLNQKQNLMATIGLLWLHDSKNSTPSFYISSHAKFLANFNIEYTVSRFSISVNGIYKDHSISPDYFLFNAKATMQILKRLSVFVQVDNIFNKSYTDIPGSVMPGRWVMGGIKWETGK